MAFDCFLKIDGIPGESADDKHAEWIEVLSYSHGMSQQSSCSTAGGQNRSAGRCDHQDLSVVKPLDKSSPKLAVYCSNGTPISEIRMELCGANGEKQKYMEYVLSDVIISSVRPGGSAQSSENVPLEEVTLNYSKIEWIYTELDPKTLKPKGDIKASWDTKANKGG